MSPKLRAMVITFVTAFVVFYLGVRFVFGPAIENDQPGEPMTFWLSLAIAEVLFVVLLAWASDATGNAVKAAMIIALSQLVLVDIYYPLAGRRGWGAALASAAVLIVGWFIVGSVYGKLTAGGEAEAGI
ncbi:MAG: hypothetical protein ACE5HP_09325, partial [Gemmatimonadota bacterium]